MDNLTELKTPRGTFKIQKVYNSRKEAISEGYCEYFVHDNWLVFVKHIGEYSKHICHFSVVCKEVIL